MHHTRGFMTRLSSHNRQKSSKSPAGRKTQKSTVSFFWVLVIQMTYKAGNALTHIPRAQKCPKTRFLGGVIWTPNRPYVAWKLVGRRPAGSKRADMGQKACRNPGPPQTEKPAPLAPPTHAAATTEPPPSALSSGSKCRKQRQLRRLYYA